MTRLIAYVYVLGAVIGTTLALVQAPKSAPTPQQQFAQTILDLGECQQERSKYQAAVVAGVLLDAVQVKNKIEAANPEYTVDPQTFKVTLKAKAKEPTP